MRRIFPVRLRHEVENVSDPTLRVTQSIDYLAHYQYSKLARDLPIAGCAFAVATGGGKRPASIAFAAPLLIHVTRQEPL